MAKRAPGLTCPPNSDLVFELELEVGEDAAGVRTGLRQDQVCPVQNSALGRM